MDLKDQRKESHGECLVCRLAGKNWRIWPQEEFGGGRFAVYIQNLDTGQGSHNRRADYCVSHAIDLYSEWIELARLEIAEDAIFNQYIDRMEQ